MSDMWTTHYSSITLHRKCPQAWAYNKIEGLSAIEDDDPRPARDFGSWWSALMAADSLERGRELGSLVAPYRTFQPIDDGPEFDQSTLTVDEVLTAADEWWSKQTEEAAEKWQDGRTGLGEDLPTRLRNTYRRWTIEHASERETEEPLGVEISWRRELPTKPGEARPRVALVGYIDELYYDRARQMVVARDHKTQKSALRPPEPTDVLMNSQLYLYAWGVSPLLSEWGVSPVRAIAFDRTRSSKPTPPKLNKSGTLSKQVTQYDLQTYYDWVAEGQTYEGLKKDGSGAGTYELDPAMVEQLKTPTWQQQFFQRSLDPISLDMVREHLRSAIDTSTEERKTSRQWHEESRAVRHIGSVCSSCDFVSLCHAQMLGGPHGEYELALHGLQADDGREYLGTSPETTPSHV